jgi:hypothetical protein
MYSCNILLLWAAAAASASRCVGTLGAATRRRWVQILLSLKNRVPVFFSFFFPSSWVSLFFVVAAVIVLLFPYLKKSICCIFKEGERGRGCLSTASPSNIHSNLLLRCCVVALREGVVERVGILAKWQTAPTMKMSYSCILHFWICIGMCCTCLVSFAFCVVVVFFLMRQFH